MTVRELRAALTDMPEDAEVLHAGDGYGTLTLDSVECKLIDPREHYESEEDARYCDRDPFTAVLVW